MNIKYHFAFQTSKETRARHIFLLARAFFQSFFFRNPLGATSRNLCDTPPHSPVAPPLCHVHTHNAIPYIPYHPHCASVSRRARSCIRVICNTRDSHTRAGDLETLAQHNGESLPRLPPANGRHGTQSLDYSTADFSRRFSQAPGLFLPATIVLPRSRRKCNFSGCKPYNTVV